MEILTNNKIANFKEHNPGNKLTEDHENHILEDLGWYFVELRKNCHT
jgi:hypothetical protein